MPHVTCAKWDRTLILQIPIFITNWISLHAALEIHLHLIIRHNVEGYRLNTYWLEVSGYSDNPWWRELYIDFEFSRLRFGNHPIGPLNDDEAPLHADRGDHMPPSSEGRPPTPPWQSDPSASGSNHTVLVSTGGNIPQLAEPPRYYNSQYLNLMGENPTLTTGSAPHECPAAETSNRILHNWDDLIDDDDLLPLPTHPIPRPPVPIELRNLYRELVPPPGHCIITPPPWPANPVERTYTGWQEYFNKFHNHAQLNWGKNPPWLIVEELSDGMSQSFQTPPQSEIEVELSRNEVDTEVAEAEPEEASTHKEQPEVDLGQLIDAWPEADQLLEDMFAPHLPEDWMLDPLAPSQWREWSSQSCQQMGIESAEGNHVCNWIVHYKSCWSKPCITDCTIMVIDRHSSYHSAEPQLTNAQKGAIRMDSWTPLLVCDHVV